LLEHHTPPTRVMSCRELELPELLEALDGGSAAAVPDAVSRDLEMVASAGGPLHLRELLSEIGSYRANVEGDLGTATSELEKEAAADGEARSRWGDRWSVPQSATLAKHLWEKLSSYKWVCVALRQQGGSVHFLSMSDVRGRCMEHLLRPD